MSDDLSDDDLAWIAEKEKFRHEHPEMDALALAISRAHDDAIGRGEKLVEFPLPEDEWRRMERIFRFYFGGANYGKPAHPKFHFLVRGIPVVVAG